MDESLDIKLKQQLKVQSVRPTLFENFTAFCKSTTFHGLQFVGNSSIYFSERFYFAASFIAMCSVAYYFIIIIYQKWAEAPVIVSIDPKSTYITDIPFPALTICNMNQAMAKAAKKVSNTSGEFIILETICNREEIQSQINKRKIKMNDISFKDFILEVAQPCRNMFLNCNFASVDINCEEIFRTVLTDEGLCCTFNSLDYPLFYSNKPDYLPDGWLNSSAKSVKWTPETGYDTNLPKLFFPRKGAGTGVKMGLTVILDAETHDYYCSSTNGAGFKFVVHSPVEAPLVKETGLNIDVGTESQVHINPLFEKAPDNIKLIDSKYRKCLFNSERKLYQFATYTRRNCEMECEAETMANNCNCGLYFMPMIKQKTSICSIKDEKCTNGVRIQLASRNNNIVKCSEICLPNCYDLSYSATTFSSGITMSNFTIRDRLIQKLNRTYVHNSISRVDFLYIGNALNAKIQKEFIDITDFLTTVGGIIGFFLGFSVISLMEVVFFLTLRPFCAELRYLRELKQKYQYLLQNGYKINIDVSYLNNNLFNIIKSNIISKVFNKYKFPYKN